jgi:hypothetical protein
VLSPGDTRKIRDIAGRNIKTLRIDLQRESLLFGEVFIELWMSIRSKGFRGFCSAKPGDTLLIA